MGIAAREKAEENYSQEEYYNKLFNLYNSLIRKRGGS
jgi:hypothetical protein